MAFPCKRRGFRTSRLGRRTVDTAVRLCDEVLTGVAVRRQVLSRPYGIRYQLAWDGAAFQRVVHGWYRRQAAWIGRGFGYTFGKISIWRICSHGRLSDAGELQEAFLLCRPVTVSTRQGKPKKPSYYGFARMTGRLSPAVGHL